jgi:hypothetical protein
VIGKRQLSDLGVWTPREKELEEGESGRKYPKSTAFGNSHLMTLFDPGTKKVEKPSVSEL